MKKLLIILTIFIFSVPAFALENLCPSTYELAGGLKRFTSNISGENLIYTKLPYIMLFRSNGKISQLKFI